MPHVDVVAGSGRCSAANPSRRRFTATVSLQAFRQSGRSPVAQIPYLCAGEMNPTCRVEAQRAGLNVFNAVVIKACAIDERPVQADRIRKSLGAENTK
jgi:hypothetical protein